MTNLGSILITTDGKTLTAFSADEIGNPISLKVVSVADCANKICELQCKMLRLNSAAPTEKSEASGKVAK